MSKLISFLIFCLILPGSAMPQSQTSNPDLCVYGGTSAGVIAAYAAARLHRSVILVEPGHRLGGLSSGGLGFTDIGNKYVVTGLARDFYRRIGSHYGKFEQWIFEPKVADSIFRDYIKRGKVTVIYDQRLHAVRRAGASITAIQLESSTTGAPAGTITAKEYIDCSYEGDLMAKAGVSYTTGREDNNTYHETVDGVQLKEKHQFPDGIDPYRIAGHPESGLLWGIGSDSLLPEGTGDKRIQSYNFRICLSNDPANRIDITRPERYDSTRYELLLRVLATHPAKTLDAFLKMDMMPNHKTDINNNGAFSTDMIGMNYDYPDGDYATRERIIQAHVDYTKGLLYFIGHDPRMPEHLRTQMLAWGYPKDEYPSTGHWTPQLYIREARRLTGVYVMTQDNCQGKIVVPDGIGQGAYNMDSHNAERLVVNGMVKNEGDVQLHGINPYPIAYRSIVPKTGQCNNLLVPVCLSASHMAYGSIRMEPVFMVLAQSAAYAACQAIDRRCAIQDIDVRALQQSLKTNPLADGSPAEILVDNDDSTGVTRTGEWIQVTTGGYGPSFWLNRSASPATVKFAPVIPASGNYAVYTYIPRLSHASTRTSITIFDGKTTVEKTIDLGGVSVSGQTSGEWISLGAIHFAKGSYPYIRISNVSADGSVVADAVLFVPIK